MRQLIQKGDPRLNILIPKTVKDFILMSAKAAKRSHQDEIIKRLAATLKHEEAFTLMHEILSEPVSTILRA